MAIIKQNGHQIHAHARDDYGVPPHLYLSVTAADANGRRRTVSMTLTREELTTLNKHLAGELDRIQSATPRRFYVNEYRVTRNYGGPEEGGWHYDSGEFVTNHGEFSTRYEACAARDSLDDYMKERTAGLPPARIGHIDLSAEAVHRAAPRPELPRQAPALRVSATDEGAAAAAPETPPGLAIPPNERKETRMTKKREKLTAEEREALAVVINMMRRDRHFADMLTDVAKTSTQEHEARELVALRTRSADNARNALLNHLDEIGITQG